LGSAFTWAWEPERENQASPGSLGDQVVDHAGGLHGEPQPEVDHQARVERFLSDVRLSLDDQGTEGDARVDGSRDHVRIPRLCVSADARFLGLAPRIPCPCRANSIMHFYSTQLISGIFTGPEYMNIPLKEIKRPGNEFLYSTNEFLFYATN
jgi:hypothetical protein